MNTNYSTNSSGIYSSKVSVKTSDNSPFAGKRFIKYLSLAVLMLVVGVSESWCIDYHRSTTTPAIWAAGTNCWLSGAACGTGTTAVPTSTDNVFIDCATKTTNPSATMTCNNLTISAGILNISSGTLTVNGILTISGGTLTISGTGVLNVVGNLVFTSGTFTHSAGTLNLTGAGQNISGALNPSFYNLNVAGTGNKTLSTSITVTGALSFGADYKLGIGSNTLNLNGTVSGMTAARSLTGSATSNLTFGGTAAVGTVFFDQTSAATRTIATYTSTTGTATHTVTLGNKLEIGTTCNLGHGLILMNAQELVLNGTFTGLSGADGNLSSAPTSSILTIGGSGALGTLWFNTTNHTLGTLTINRTSSGTLTIGGTAGTEAVLVNTTFNLTAGQTTLGGDLALAAVASIVGSPSTSNMIVTSASSGYFVHRISSTGSSSKLYPIGEIVGVTAGEYSGFTLSVSSNSSNNRKVGYRVVDAALTSPPSDYISRYWVSNASIATGTFNWSASLPYNGTTGDINGTESKMFAGYNTASTYAITYGGTVNTTAKTLDLTGSATQLNTTAMYFTGGNISCSNPSGPQTFHLTSISNTSTPVTMSGDVGLQFNTNVTGVIIFANTTNSTASPVDFTDYNVGDVVGTQIVVYKGGTVSPGGVSGSNFTVTWTYDANAQGGADLAANQFYYFTIYSYSSGASCNTKYSGTWNLASMAPVITNVAPSGTSCNNTGSSFNLSYTFPSGVPNQYQLIWNTAAATAGFVNNPSSNASNTSCGANYITLPSSPIVVTIPAGVQPGTYTGYINPKNSINGYDNCTYNGPGLGNCPSFTVTITAATAAPTGTTPQAVCPGATVADLVATGTAIQWYAAATGGSPLASSTALVAGTHYYASQTLTGCESTTRFDVTVITPLSGSINVPGAYPTLTGAGGLFNAINTNGLGGNLTVNITADITETGANALNQWTESCGSGYTVNIVPSATSLRTLSGNFAGALISLTGADNVTFDGRYNGTGTTSYLTFSNLNTSGQTFSFTNDAQYNVIKYCTITGVNTSTTSGVVVFGTAGSGTGNDNNTLDYCDIKDGASTPMNCIYSLGTASKENSNITISNCNIYNFYSTSASPCGISVSTNNTQWSITGNRLFQTATRAGGANYYGVFVNNAGSGYNINNNIIGYSSSSGTGTLTFSPGATNRFNCIYLTASNTGTINNITGNTIANISLGTSSGGSLATPTFSGIYVSSGKYLIDNNTIGSLTGTGALAVTVSSALGTINPVAAIMVNSTASGQTISNNNIGSITLTNASGNVATYLDGIYVNNGSLSVKGNTIGGSTVNSIQIVSNAGGSTGSTASGIRTAAGAAYTDSVLTNNIKNITNGAVTSSSTTGGIISSSGGQFIINGNTISALTSSGTQASTGSGAAVFGISMVTGNSSDLSISNNTIYDLTANGASNNAAIIGITYNGGSSTSNKINGNFIHSFNHTVNSSTSQQMGIEVPAGSGVATVSNNMIRLGKKADGSDFGADIILSGISDGSSNAQNIWFNTVLINGTASASTNKTYAYRRIVASGADDIRNNIFANNRTGSGTPIHFAFSTNGVTGLTAAGFDYNIFHSLTNTEFSINNGSTNLSGAATPALRLQAMRANAPAGNNLHSGIATFSKINFVNAAGNSSAVDLRLNSSTSAADAGIAISTITTDRDGSPATRLDPPDIGADEGSFAALDATTDIYTPVVSVSSVSPLSISCGTTATVTITATVTDAGIGLATGALAPTLWWRLSTGTYAALLPTSSSGSTFTYDLNLTGLTTGQTYEYYVAAQDQASTPNVWYSSYNATTPVHTSVSATPSPVNAVPSTFTTTGGGTPLSGTVTVPGTYPTLTGAGGLFAAINTNGLSGDLTVNITNNTAETGINGLNEWSECGIGGYKLTIQSDGLSTNGGPVRTLSGTYSIDLLFRINGADRVTFNGGTGTTRNLILRNTDGTYGTINFANDCVGDKINNCDVQNNGSCIQVYAAIPATASVIIDNNDLHNDVTNTTTLPNYGLYVGNSSATVTVTNNKVYNYFVGGIYFNSVSNNCTITDNSCYLSGFSIAIGTSINYGIFLNAGNSHIVTGNIIGGDNSTGTGSAYTITSNGQFTGIYFAGAAGGTPSDISGNQIQNISLTSNNSPYFYGIDIESGKANIGKSGAGNTIGNASASLGITVGGTSANNTLSRGIFTIGSSSADVVNISYNTISNIIDNGTGTAGSLRGIKADASGPGISIDHNTISDLTSYGRTNNYSYYDGTQTSYASNTYQLCGILISNTNSGGSPTISDNTISNLKCAATTAVGPGIVGIGIDRNITGQIFRNKIFGFTNTATGTTAFLQPGIQGIRLWDGAWKVYNNQIIITNGSNTNYVRAYGINDCTGQATNYFYNSVYIGGSQNTGTNTTAAFIQTYTSNTLVLRNNIFYNERINTGGSSNHYCLYLIPGTAPTAFNSNNNLLYAPGANHWIGQYNGTNQATIAGWRTVLSPNIDVNSQNGKVLFVSNPPTSDLTPDGTPNCWIDGKGTPITSGSFGINVSDDYVLTARNSSTPDIGAFEFTSAANPLVTLTDNSNSSTSTTALTVCEGSSYSAAATTLAPTPLTYSWTVPDGANVGTAINFTRNAASNMAGSQNVTITDNIGCAYTAAATLTVTTTAAPTGTSAQSFCLGANPTVANLTASGTSIQWYAANTGGSPLAGSTALVDGSHYYATQTVSGCESATRFDVTVAFTNCGIFWDGSTDNNWNDGTNWSNGSVPLSTANVNIPVGMPRYPIITTTTIAINNVDIDAGASLTVNSGAAFTVNGVFTNNGTVNVANNGNFIQTTGSTLAGSGTFNVTRNGTSSATVYNYWSSPITSASLGLLGGANYLYNPGNGTATFTDDNPGPDPGWSAASGSFSIGKGYAGQGPNSTVTFTGTANNGTQTAAIQYFPLVNGSSSPGVPYNLLGNIYPSNIDAATFLTANNTKVTGAIYYWDDDNTGGTGYAANDYAIWNGTGSTGGGGRTPNGMIATAQGFFVQALSGATSVSFTNAMRASTATTFFKTEETVPQRLWLRADNGLHTNQILVGYVDGATEDMDWFYDAQKLRGNQTISFYSLLNDTTLLGIQGLAPLNGADPAPVPLGLYAGAAGQNSIFIDSIENFPANMPINLLDADLGIIYDLRNGPYVFQTAQGEDNNRFVLFPNEIVTALDEQETLHLNIYPNPNNGTFTVMINSGIEQQVKVSLFDVTGKLVLAADKTISSGNNFIALETQVAGVYMLKVETADKAYNKRVVVY